MAEKVNLMTGSENYSVPAALHKIPESFLDLRSDAEIDHSILHPKPITDEKNVFFFWHSGYEEMHPYTKRNVRAWHRRFSKRGWVIRVLDRQPSSNLNVANYLDTSDPALFPQSFISNTIGGQYALQHTSDLVRWPLLLKYGGVYADVGLIQIGDLDRLWNETIGNPDSPFDLVSYNAGGIEVRNLTNYFLASGKDNPLFARCHKLLLELWAADGGREDTVGMHDSPLLKGVGLLGGSFTMKEDGRIIEAEEASRMLTDYIIQGQVMTMVMGLVDEDDGWNGPQYVSEHVYAIEFMEGSQLVNALTEWNGQRAYDLMSLQMPNPGEAENDEQKEAREMVESCLQRSFGFKLAHGMILKVYKSTLGSLWRGNPGSDNVPGTYAYWFRHATMYWNQDNIPERLRFDVLPPFKTGHLLEAV